MGRGFGGGTWSGATILVVRGPSYKTDPMTRSQNTGISDGSLWGCSYAKIAETVGGVDFGRILVQLKLREQENTCRVVSQQIYISV
jgi:hypothetical protein